MYITKLQCTGWWFLPNCPGGNLHLGEKYQWIQLYTNESQSIPSTYSYRTTLLHPFMSKLTFLQSVKIDFSSQCLNLLFSKMSKLTFRHCVQINSSPKCRNWVFSMVWKLTFLQSVNIDFSPQCLSWLFPLCLNLLSPQCLNWFFSSVSKLTFLHSA